MTERAFYRNALFSPLVVTIASWLIVGVDKRTEAFSTHAETVVSLAIVFAYGGLWAAVPYLFVAAIIWVWLSRGPTHSSTYARILVAAPLATIVVGILIALAVGLLRGNFAIASLAMFYAVWGIVLGYTYVLAILLIHFVASKAGWVTADY